MIEHDGFQTRRIREIAHLEATATHIAHLLRTATSEALGEERARIHAAYQNLLAHYPEQPQDAVPHSPEVE